MCSKIIIIEVLQILCTTILIIDNLYFSLQNPVLCYNIPPGIENHIHKKIVKVLANYMVKYNKKLLLFLSQDKSAGVLPSLNRHKNGCQSLSVFRQRRLSGVTSWSTYCKWGMIQMCCSQCLTGRRRHKEKNCCRTLLWFQDQTKVFWWLDGPVVLGVFSELHPISLTECLLTDSVVVISWEYVCDIFKQTNKPLCVWFLDCA